MRTLIFEGVVTALSSITHNGGESYGINAKLRREKFVQPDGSVEEVPVISGNSMRGVLRDRGMYDFCRRLGYGVNTEAGEVYGLSREAFDFLFSGGSLTSTGSERLDIDKAREIRELIPLVGVFGGAVGNMILPGKLRCGKLVPIVRETRHLLPEAYKAEARESIWEYAQEEMYTRKDDKKNEHLRRMIGGTSRALLDDPTTRRAALSEGRGATPTQMMYYVETLAAGTRFYWRLQLDDVTDVEFEAFLSCLAEFSRHPFVGGKSAVGLGEVAVKFDGWVEIDSRLGVDGKALDRPIGTRYTDHVREKGDQIRALLESIA